jgi:hypothetical protein
VTLGISLTRTPSIREMSPSGSIAATPEARVIALGLMEGHERLRDFDVALDAIERSRSAFEQYHGLQLAELMVKELTPGKRAQLKRAVERALRSRRVRKDTDREKVAMRIKIHLQSDGGRLG